MGFNRHFSDIDIDGPVSLGGGTSPNAGEVTSDGSDVFFGTSGGTKQASAIGTGGSTSLFGTYGTTLSGGTVSSPATGLAAEIQSAIDTDNTPLLNITGVWSMGGEVSYSSRADTPAITWNGRDYRLPVHIDATGAMIEYGGSGWAFTDDHDSANGGSHLRGGVTHLHGGNWVATGSPSGWFRGRDIGKCIFSPAELHDWDNGGSGDCLLLEAITSWCEDNFFGPTYIRNCDTAYRTVDNNTTENNISFQDNTIFRVKCDRIQNGAAAIDLGGNYVDCEIYNPVGIAGSADVALFRHNANMGGTIILRPEFEDGNEGVTHYHVRLGPEARMGPLQVGGQPPTASGYSRFDLTNDPSAWTWHQMHTQDSGVDYTYKRFGGSGQSWGEERSGGGLKLGGFATRNDATPSYTMQFHPSTGDITIEGVVNDQGTV